MTDKPISAANARIFLHHGKVSGGKDKTNASTSLLGTASDNISIFNIMAVYIEGYSFGYSLKYQFCQCKSLEWQLIFPQAGGEREVGPASSI